MAIKSIEDIIWFLNGQIQDKKNEIVEIDAKIFLLKQEISKRKRRTKEIKEVIECLNNHKKKEQIGRLLICLKARINQLSSKNLRREDG